MPKFSQETPIEGESRQPTHPFVPPTRISMRTEQSYPSINEFQRKPAKQRKQKGLSDNMREKAPHLLNT
jgi:hypothetical protein